MHTTTANRAVAWGLLAIAVLANIAGYLWNLYDRFWWFDEVVHGYTSFALTLALGLVLYGAVLTGVHRHRLPLILAIAGLGLAVGALWEVAEWAYDQVVPADAILGKRDTIIDLIMDTIGAVAAGVVASWMVGQCPAHQS